ncbi:MAG: hypothetical protein G8345_17615 [Magnetococcales bacterium]|nr:hypothetical protein [Magnetococcales bacterium]
MANQHTGHARQQQREHGSILLVVLILMTVLATIGLQSMSTTSLQERMTSNSLDGNVSFQSAEAALRAAESWLESQAGRPTAVSSCTTNPCNVWTKGSISYSSNYVNSTFWTTYARSYSSSSSTSHYIIEETTETYSDTSSTGDSVKTGTGGTSSSNTTYFYRITARGSGKSGTSIVVVQSTYAKTF